MSAVPSFGITVSNVHLNLTVRRMNCSKGTVLQWLQLTAAADRHCQECEDEPLTDHIRGVLPCNGGACICMANVYPSDV